MGRGGGFAPESQREDPVIRVIRSAPRFETRRHALKDAAVVAFLAVVLGAFVVQIARAPGAPSRAADAHMAASKPCTSPKC